MFSLRLQATSSFIALSFLRVLLPYSCLSEDYNMATFPLESYLYLAQREKGGKGNFKSF